MQWKYEAIADLKELTHKRAAMILIPEEVEALDEHITSIRSSATDAIRVDGGDDHRAEDALLDAITKRDKLVANLHVVKTQVDAIERALEGMPDNMRDILVMSFVDRVSVDDIGDELHVERATVYRMRDKALRMLAIRLYGVVDT